MDGRRGLSCPNETCQGPNLVSGRPVICTTATPAGADNGCGFSWHGGVYWLLETSYLSLHVTEGVSAAAEARLFDAQEMVVKNGRWV